LPMVSAGTIEVSLGGSLTRFGSGEPHRAQTFRALAGLATKLTVFVDRAIDPGGLNFRVLLTEVDLTSGFRPTNVLFETNSD